MESEDALLMLEVVELTYAGIAVASPLDCLRVGWVLMFGITMKSNELIAIKNSSTTGSITLLLSFFVVLFVILFYSNTTARKMIIPGIINTHGLILG